MRGNWRMVVAVLTVVCAGVLVLTVLLVKGLDTANQLAGVLGLSALGVAVVGWARRARPHPPAPAQVDAAAALLRGVVHTRWRAEATSRSLLDPSPLRVRWRATAREVSDHPEVIGGKISGTSDAIGRFARDFMRLPRKRLVIIGAPGSGKSTLALLLTLQLATEAAADRPVPVLLSLASWDPDRERLSDWIARRITTDYPSISGAPDFGPGMARLLLDTGRLLPVLDGLDEIPGDRGGSALAQINRSIPADEPVVLVCRAVEYEAAVDAGDVLTGAYVIEAQPVQAPDALAYLRKVVPPGPQSRRWAPVFNALERGTHPTLARALSSPLTISLARAVYRTQGDPADLLDIADAEALENHLIASLVPSALSETSYDIAKALRWLGFLADHLDALATHDFAWWRLNRSQRAQTLVAHGLVAVLVLVTATIGLVVVARTAMVVAGLSTGVAVAFLLSLHTVLSRSRSESALVQPSLRLRGRLGALGRHLANGLWRGLLAGLIGGGLSVLLVRLTAGADVGAVRILVGGTAGGLVAGVGRAVLSWSLVPLSRAGDTGPAETLRAARNRTLVIGVGLGAALGLACGAVIGVYLSMMGVAGSGVLGAALGVGYGIVLAASALLTGPWFPYALTRSLLAVRGRLPWRLIAFLDDLYDLGVLRRIGPVYQFRHARVQGFLGSAGHGRTRSSPSSLSAGTRTVTGSQL
ncbi:NACHT domain-containing protein [Nonomuraea turkmeniaca]|uniref:NACHT domain-containing protein n=1 Tax=Nonomuraea turkmeniaca TaxID=103838 RepID=UPI00147700BA|nr:NACHT domain-containing protein [Nonomuraea turkmeniaca]